MRSGWGFVVGFATAAAAIVTTTARAEGQLPTGGASTKNSGSNTQKPAMTSRSILMQKHNNEYSRFRKNRFLPIIAVDGVSTQHSAAELSRVAPVARHIFQQCSQHRKVLAVNGLEEFLVKYQQEGDHIADKLKELCPDLRWTWSDFATYLFSERNALRRTFFGLQQSVHDEIDNPFDKKVSEYWIASSHNTYLTGNQWSSPSSADRYRHALQSGLRCIEIDVWDGPNGQPIVTHGYTWTTKVLLKDVLATVSEFAFRDNTLPVIISLENHCSTDQQRTLVQQFREYLGEDNVEADKGLLPILNRSVKGFEKRFLIQGTFNEANESLRERLIRQLKTTAETASQKISEVTGQHQWTDVDEHKKDIELEISKAEQKRIEYITTLYDMFAFKAINTAEFVKRRALEVQSELPALGRISLVPFSEVWNASETGVRRALDYGLAKSIERFSRHHLIRVYPHGLRFSSHNFLPLDYWRLGCQLVSLNDQERSGLPWALHDGLFATTRYCGYVPHSLAAWSRTPKRVWLSPLAAQVRGTAAPVQLAVSVQGVGTVDDGVVFKTATFTVPAATPHSAGHISYTGVSFKAAGNSGTPEALENIEGRTVSGVRMNISPHVMPEIPTQVFDQNDTTVVHHPHVPSGRERPDVVGAMMHRPLSFVVFSLHDVATSTVVARYAVPTFALQSGMRSIRFQWSAGEKGKNAEYDVAVLWLSVVDGEGE